MITVKEFAKKQHRSVQAIYQSIDRYKLQLEGHIKKVGRTSYLDDEAVLNHLPWIATEEVGEILHRKAELEINRYMAPDGAEE